MNDLLFLFVLAVLTFFSGLPAAFNVALITGTASKRPDAGKEQNEKGHGTALFKKGGGGSAPSPDPAIGQAALKQAQLGEEWLNFAREQFAEGNERQKKMDELTGRVTGEQLASMERQNKWALEDRDRYKNVFQPMEDKFIKEAEGWDSPERQEQMAAEAKADVLGNADAQRQAMVRQQAGMGVNPNSGRFQAAEREGNLNTALASAGAQNSARNQVISQGMALRADAINMGKGLPAQSAQAAGLGLGAGNAAVGNMAAGNQGFYQNAGLMGQGFQGAMGGYAGQANTLNSLYGNQLNAWAANRQAGSSGASGLMSGLGSLMGAALHCLRHSHLKNSKRIKSPYRAAP
ncbi:MAG: hypothetical protein ACRC5A_08905 [Enterobacteriaceae bacterium]